MSTYEGHYVAPADARFAIVASRFNHFVVDRLVEGAQDGLRRHGVDEERIDTVLVPGAWELPLVTARLLKSEKYAAVIALGAVIRGATPHFDYVAGESSKGIARVGLDTGVPITFGVITADTVDQAVQRAGVKSGNRGWDAGMNAVEMASLMAAI